jgi:hypothetical protein
MQNGESIKDMKMKITNPIDERLWKALNHVCGYAEHKSDCMTDADYAFSEGLKDSIKLLREYSSCFGADGRISQRGEKPSAWNTETIFDDYNEVSEYNFTDETSAEQKDANAKKLLEELT